jgi:subtilisin family serine protease
VRRSVAWRTLLSLGLAGSLAGPALGGPVQGHAATSGAPHRTPGDVAGRNGKLMPLTPEQAQALSQHADRKVIVIMKDQYPDLPARGMAMRARRAAAIQSDQSVIVSELGQVHASRVVPFSLINAVAATVSPDEEARLQANPAVRAVVPDRVIRAPKPARSLDALESSVGAAAAGVQPNALPQPATACRDSVSIEPEALEQSDFGRAQNLVGGVQNAGSGVKVAFMAEGIDTQNPDFLRPTGQSVFVDYKDFTGDGTNAPTTAGEAFLDASSIGAQGNQVYDVSKPVAAGGEGAGVFISPDVAPARPQCRIKIVGTAPAVSLVSLKVFGQNNASTTSGFVQAIQYAVTTGVNVLSQSFGANLLPDFSLDPIALADQAAIAAGVTVIASSGDAGTSGTLGSPSTVPQVIEAGATTQLRFYNQTGYRGAQLGSGAFVSNNISALSSAGFSQNDPVRTVDLVAGGDLSWAVCTPNPALYIDCTDVAGTKPARVEVAGGTSEAAPLTAGAAALVIQAYRSTHNGATPTPAEVKQILMSAARDLNIPTYEQGAGLLNASRAVQLALSIPDNNGAPARVGSNLLVTTSGAGNQLQATDLPGTLQTFKVTVQNTGQTTQRVFYRSLPVPFLAAAGVQTQGTPSNTQAAGTPSYSASFAPSLSPATDPTFRDIAGNPRPYKEVDFTVPRPSVGRIYDRLDVSIAFDAISSPGARVFLTLFDPNNSLIAHSLPQGFGSGYGHVDVANVKPGAYRAIVFTTSTVATTPTTLGRTTSAYTGTVKMDVVATNFLPAPNASVTVDNPNTTIAPGDARTYTIQIPTPAQPGDLSARFKLNVFSGYNPATGSAYSFFNNISVPIALRSIVPTGASGGSFTGSFTGGNSRPGAGPVSIYQFDVPANQSDLDLSFAVPPGSNDDLQGVLIDPNGQPVDVQTTLTAYNRTTLATGLPPRGSLVDTMQFFRRNPQPGRWRFLLLLNFFASGQQTVTPFTVNIGFNGVNVASTLPNSPSTTIVSGTAQTFQVQVTNTGNTTKDFFVDPRLDPAAFGTATVGLIDQSQSITDNLTGNISYTLPLTAGELNPVYVVDPESSRAVFQAFGATIPVSDEVYNLNGAPGVGALFSPDVEATSGQASDGTYFATVSLPDQIPLFGGQQVPAPTVATGFYGTSPAPGSPPLPVGANGFGQPGGPAYGTTRTRAFEVTQQFDNDLGSSTGNFVTDVAPAYAPLRLAPGQSGTITVTISPSGANGGPGTNVRGFLYVDAVNVNSATLGNITSSLDEVRAIPYSYTVG